MVCMTSRTEHIAKLLLLATVVVMLLFLLRTVSNSTDEVTQNTNEETTVIEVEDEKEQTEEAEPEPEPALTYPVVYSLEEAGSLTVVINKKHRLPENYAPMLESVPSGQLRPEAAAAVNNMLSAASNDGIPMKIISAYRSYQTQVNTYQRWVSIQGKAQADRSSARPGHSEHQTGLAVDVGVPDGTCDLLICFGDTAQGKWVAQNAADYGFIVRYESDTEDVTGYQYEPWHLRYVGVNTAKAIASSGLTMDQYYDVPAGDYVE